MTELKHIVAGFPEDLDRITSEYSRISTNLKLTEFLEYWDRAHLDCLFANRFDPRELLESIVEINKRLVTIVTDDLSAIEPRTVALYMLLCLAVKQPKRLRRKVRLTCSDAISVNKLCDDVIRLKGHLETKFCWQHLRSEDCIDFVEDRRVYGPSLLSNRGNKNIDTDEIRNKGPLASARAETREFIYDRLEPNLRQLDSICKQYNQIRDLLQLDGMNDATVDLESKGTLSDYLERAKSLLVDFKTSENL